MWSKYFNATTPIYKEFLGKLKDSHAWDNEKYSSGLPLNFVTMYHWGMWKVTIMPFSHAVLWIRGPPVTKCNLLLSRAVFNIKAVLTVRDWKLSRRTDFFMIFLSFFTFKPVLRLATYLALIKLSLNTVVRRSNMTCEVARWSTQLSLNGNMVKQKTGKFNVNN